MKKDNDDSLPDLTDKEFGFAMDLLRGETGADAYRRNYEVSGMSDNSIYVEASRLKNGPKVSLWLDRARKDNSRRAAVTKEEHNADLEKLKTLALEKGDFASALRAMRAQGELHGHYVSLSKSLTPTEKATDDELIKSIAEKMNISPDEVKKQIKATVH